MSECGQVQGINLIAAPYTAMDENGDIDISIIESQVNHFRTRGLAGVFVCGTTGEGLSLTLDERMAVTHEWARLANNELKIMVQVTHSSIRDAQQLAEHAQGAGVDAISVAAPFMYTPKRSDTLAEYLKEIAAAAPDLPLYYYHIPSVTGSSILPSELLNASLDRVPTLAGVKFTDQNLSELKLCRQRYGRTIELLFGRDEMLLGGLATGIDGAIGSSYNFAAPLYHELIAAFHRGDIELARRMQSQSVQLINILRRFGSLPAGKAVMKMIGIDCGPVRRPLVSLSAGDYDELKRELSVGGFLEAFAA